MKKLFVLLMALSFLATPVWAEHSKGGKQCSMKGGGCTHEGSCDSDKKDDCGCPIMSKFFKKAHFFMENADEIGLSEDQQKTIKALKMEAKKVMIQQGAGMEIMQMDMEEKLSETKLDVQGINQMIDKGMAEMAAGAKASVERYAKLKAVLSEEQMKKAKEIWKKNS